MIYKHYKLNMSAFKSKPSKVKHLTTVQTLDGLHKDFMSKCTSTFDMLEYISKTGSLIVDYYTASTGLYYNTTSQSQKDNIENETKKSVQQPSQDANNVDNTATQEITKDDTKNDIKNDTKNATYKNEDDNYLKILNLQSQKNRKEQKQVKPRKIEKKISSSNTILKYFENFDEPIVEQPQQQQKINKAALQEQYRILMDKNYACSCSKISKSSYCSQCNVEKTLCISEGCYVCDSCGETEYIIIESEGVNYKDVNNDKPKYPYKKINHLKEKLNQFQSKETAEVPDSVYNTIMLELKRKMIVRYKNLSPLMIKSILKKHKLTNYYEHLQQIYCKITNSSPMILQRELEEEIIHRFQTMQPSFQKHCSGIRNNFLSYSYVLNKLFIILGYENYAKYFGLLKSKDKLRSQDSIWSKICKDMNWKFHSSF